MKTIELLGLKVRDKVTAFEGIVTSVSFDLYGCVQALVNPGLGKEGKLGDLVWLDVSRLDVQDSTPVMPVPNFDIAQEPGDKGPEAKPVQGP